MIKMKTLYKILFIAVSVSSLAFSCNKDKDEDNGIKPEVDKLRVKIVPMYEGNEMTFSDIYETQEGYRIRFSKLNIILTEVKDGNKKLFESAVYRFENSKVLTEVEGDYTDFKNLKGVIGVTEEGGNHDDPSARDLEDPLNIMNVSDMHWGWNTGYIYAMIEGRVDTTGTAGADLNAVFLYHPGRTFLLQEFELEDIVWEKVGDKMHETTWYLDMEKLFDSANVIDIKSERTSHTDPVPEQEELSMKIMENLKEAFRSK